MHVLSESCYIDMSCFWTLNGPYPPDFTCAELTSSWVVSEILVFIEVGVAADPHGGGEGVGEGALGAVEGVEITMRCRHKVRNTLMSGTPKQRWRN